LHFIFVIFPLAEPRDVADRISLFILAPQLFFTLQIEIPGARVQFARSYEERALKSISPLNLASWNAATTAARPR
jgi:hypothetical protein